MPRAFRQGPGHCRAGRQPGRLRPGNAAGASAPVLGARRLQAHELLQMKENGKKKKIHGYGILYIHESLDSLVLETIEEIDVKGKILCSARVREHFEC